MSAHRSSHSTGGSPSSGSTLKVLARGNACLSCRRRKQRCDGGKPTCQQCLRYNRARECVYEEKPKSEVELLEERVKHLEDLLAQALQRNREESPAIRNSTSSSIVATRASPVLERASPQDLPRPDIALEESGSQTVELPVSRALKVKLLNVFFMHVYQFNFSVDLAKFRRSLELPTQDPQRPHPALTNAIYLLGSHFSEDPTDKQYEHTFLNLAQRHLDDSLAHVDRLLDFLLATTLLAQFNLIKGNIAKGSYLASSAMSFAVGCGLHRISGNGQAYVDVALLPPPADAGELAERINVFSSVFQIDRRASLESGVPATVPDQYISTPWPRALRRSAFGNDWDGGSSTVSSLYSTESQAASVDGDVVLAVRAKATALLDRSTRQARLAATLRENDLPAFDVDWGVPLTRQYLNFPYKNPALDAADHHFWESYQALDLALRRFRNSLPDIASTVFSQSSIIDDETEDAYLYQMLPLDDPGHLGHTLTYAHISAAGAVIQLHGIFADKDESEHAIVLDAARDIVRVVQTIGTINPRRLHMLIGIGIAAGARVLIDETRRLHDPSIHAVHLQGEIDLLKGALRELAGFYPGLHVYLEDVERLSV